MKFGVINYPKSFLFSDISFVVDYDSSFWLDVPGSTVVLSNRKHLDFVCYLFTFTVALACLGKEVPGPVGLTGMDSLEMKWDWVFSPSRISQNPTSI